MRSSASWLFTVALGALAACGGKVVVDGTGGAGGTGGTGGMFTSSGCLDCTTTTTTTATTTTTTTSTTSTSSSGNPACPDPFPGIFTKCDVEGMECPIPLACCGGDALCKGGFWQYIGPFCDQPCAPDCGPDGFACTPGAVCVAHIGPITTYQCEKDPCPNGLACSCAEPLCAEQMMSCNNIQGGFKVLCD